MELSYETFEGRTNAPARLLQFTLIHNLNNQNMKKLLSMLAIMALIACSNEDETLETKSQNKTIQNVSAIRSFDEALQIAQNSIELLDGKAATRAAKPRTIDMKANKVVRATSTRGSSMSNDTLMYVFNFEDNQGFTVVAAPQNVEPLIAVTEKGSYDPENPGDNEGFNLYMEKTKEYIAGFGGHPDLPVLQYYEIVEEYDEQRGPFVSVNWGQDNPEGEFCPNGKAGCLSVALAQIMSYYEYPSSMDLTYPGADQNTQALNWTSIKAHPTGHTYDACISPSIHEAIGRLHRQLGYLSNSIYYNSGNTASALENVPSALASMNFVTGNIINYNYTYIANQLYINHPLLIIGGGAAWNVDGYKLHRVTVETYERVAANVNEYVLVSTQITNSYLFHYNWCWYGDCNGYFATNVFNPQSGTTYDGIHLEPSHDFSNNVRVFSFYPEEE